MEYHFLGYNDSFEVQWACTRRKVHIVRHQMPKCPPQAQPKNPIKLKDMINLTAFYSGAIYPLVPQSTSR